MSASENALSGYITVTLAYWAFMLTDGALRMLVLLHFYTLGYSPFLLANLFLVYELMGIVTNLLAGWLGARYGIYTLLFVGLGGQIFALITLTQLVNIESAVVSIIFVMLVQGGSGIAKDLTKTGAKSAIKLLSTESDGGQLFRWVAALTGSKNAIKGLGFFCGALLLGWIGFNASLLVLAGLLLLVFIAASCAPRPKLGRINPKQKFKEVFSTNASVNRLSAARLFLFGARDTWFVVALPVFLHASLTTYFSVSQASAFFAVGAFMASWIIGYGVIQAIAPSLLKNARHSAKNSTHALQYSTAWVAATLVLLSLVPMIGQTAGSTANNALVTSLLLGGLLLFGGIFAITSSLHSYLILAFTNESRATMDVGFYYMSNAAGRLLGTLLSGISYQAWGITGCLLVAAAMAAMSYVFTSRLLSQIQASN